MFPYFIHGTLYGSLSKLVIVLTNLFVSWPEHENCKIKKKNLNAICPHKTSSRYRKKSVTLEWDTRNVRDLLCVQHWTRVSHCREVSTPTLEELTQTAQRSCNHSAGVVNIGKDCLQPHPEQAQMLKSPGSR